MTDDSRLWVGTSSGLYHVIYTGQYWESIDFIQLAAADDPPPLPALLSMGPCYPNPFNPRPPFRYTCLKPAGSNWPSMTFWGENNARWRRRPCQRVNIDFVWDGRDDSGRTLASGIYFCRLTDGQTAATRRLILLQ